MAPVVVNCRKCKKIFQKRLADICPECVRVEEEQFTVLYRTLQKSASQGGILIDDLAADVGMSVEDIERFYLEGRLSTAGIYLKMQCQACGMVMRDLDRRGRYCVKCSETTANQAGVEVKSIQELEKQEKQAQEQAQRMGLLKRSQAAERATRKFGAYHSR